MSLYQKYPALLDKFWGIDKEWVDQHRTFNRVEEFSRKKKLERAFQCMTSEEQMNYACYKFCGMPIYSNHGQDLTIYMGMSALERLRNYEDFLIKKYEHPDRLLFQKT